ncbi:MAG: DUF5686 and carboxypeptidase regulatory-like domain-containing protein, partial [Ignavibacteria bacterium]|nr:DUF5686 and carboxypeptidase regulatory-like domain-containing protein [Ignavibacteria bacterium]
MKIIYLIIAVLLISNNIFSQTFVLSGQIVDAQSGESLSYGNVRVLNTTLGTAANTNGDYELKLSPGEYSLVASYIGYYSDTISVNLNKDLKSINFTLKKTEILLPDIVIRPGENPALDIIRKAIEKKNERNEKLNTYEFEAYTKGMVRTTDEISARGRTVSAGIGAGDDSVDLKITGILENQSKGYFKKPDQFKDVIIARKQSANFPPTINVVTGGRLIQNFYEDDIRFFGSKLPGPISDDALDYYYYYLERVVMMDDRKVYKLFLSPENSDDPGFVGNIFINDSTYELIQVDLELNRSANIGGIFDTISIFQQFSSYDGIYMPADYRLFMKGNFLGLARFGFELNTILYDYKINLDLSDDVFSKAIVTVLPDADKKDSLYWTSAQTVPNTTEEESAYNRIDSLQRLPFSFWDQFSWLSTRTYFSENFSINGTLNSWRFNSVEGFTPRLGFYLEDYLDQRLNSSLNLAYGFSDERFKIDFGFEYLLGDYRTTSINFDIYNSIKELFGTSDDYTDLTASLLALFNKQEFRSYYYSTGFKFDFESEVFPVLDLSVGFLTHKDKDAYTNTQYSFFRKDKDYPQNPPIYETGINALTAGFKLDFRDYIEDGYFRRRTFGGDTYTIFSGDITFSNKDLLNSDLDYTTYHLYIDNFTRSFRSTFFNLEMFGMYNVGTLPYQNMYALPGNLQWLAKPFSFRTLRVNEIFGERVVTLFFEYNFRD